MEAICPLNKMTSMDSGQTKPPDRAVTPSANRQILLAEASREDEELFRGALYRTGLQNPVQSVHSSPW